MKRNALPSTTTLLVAGLVAATLGFGGTVLAQTRRPTPHQAIERNLAPFTRALQELQLTEAERAEVNDLVDRAETWSAEMVEAERHGDQGRLRSRERRIEALVRALRARVDAIRAEASAREAEQRLLDAETRRTNARAALERVAERRIALDRAESVSTWTLPAPDADASTQSTRDAAVAATGDGGAR